MVRSNTRETTENLCIRENLSYTLQKAFDSFDLVILLEKLIFYGVWRTELKPVFHLRIFSREATFVGGEIFLENE